MRNEERMPGSGCWVPPTRRRRQSPLWIGLKALFDLTANILVAIVMSLMVVLACFAVTAIVTAVANAVK